MFEIKKRCEHTNERLPGHHTLKKTSSMLLSWLRISRHPSSWEENLCAGIDWMRGFLSRRPTLSIRKLEATSLARCTAFNPHTWNEYFGNLETLFSKHKIEAHLIYNMDETALTTVHVPPQVIAGKNVKQVGQVTSAERGILVTTICCVSAGGNAIPPAFVCSRKTERDLERYSRHTRDGV